MLEQHVSQPHAHEGQKACNALESQVQALSMQDQEGLQMLSWLTCQEMEMQVEL